MGFFHDQKVAEVLGRRGRSCRFSGLIEAHQDERHEEGLLCVRPKVSQLNDQGPVEEQTVQHALPGVESHPLGTETEVPDPGPQRTTKIPADLGVVPGSVDDGIDRGQEIRECREGEGIYPIGMSTSRKPAYQL